jgi:hypothetical protein
MDIKILRLKLGQNMIGRLVGLSGHHGMAVRAMATGGHQPHQPSTFVQDQPHHENAFTSDAFLIRCLKQILPQDAYREIESDLVRFGDRVRTDIWRLGQQCEAEPPTLQATNAWGRRTDDIITSDAWKAQKRVSAEEGLVAIPYEQSLGHYSRLYQVAKLFLYTPASGLYSCPLAMTDGAAKTLQGKMVQLLSIRNIVYCQNRYRSKHSPGERGLWSPHQSRSRLFLDLRTMDDGKARRIRCQRRHGNLGHPYKGTAWSLLARGVQVVFLGDGQRHCTGVGAH